MKKFILIIIILQIWSFKSFSQSCTNLSNYTYTSTGGIKPADWPGLFSTGTMPKRLFRDGFESNCNVPKACPGNFSSPLFAYHTYKLFNNSNNASCITVMLNTGSCTFNVHMFAVLNDFTPTVCGGGNIFLGDVGSSVSQPFSFTVPANSAFTIVAQSNDRNILDCTYSFSVSTSTPNAYLTCSQNDVIPTLGEWGLIILALLVIGVSLVFMASKKFALAIGSDGNMSSNISFGPMVKSILLENRNYIVKSFIVIYGLINLIFFCSIQWFEYVMTNADIIGSIISSAILAVILPFIKINNK